MNYEALEKAAHRLLAMEPVELKNELDKGRSGDLFDLLQGSGFVEARRDETYIEMFETFSSEEFEFITRQLKSDDCVAVKVREPDQSMDVGGSEWAEAA